MNKLEPFLFCLVLVGWPIKILLSQEQLFLRKSQFNKISPSLLPLPFFLFWWRPLPPFLLLVYWPIHFLCVVTSFEQLFCLTWNYFLCPRKMTQKCHCFHYFKLMGGMLGAVQKLRNAILENFWLPPPCIWKVFCSKNAENEYFDQGLECAAPKRWSKYTTMNVNVLIALHLFLKKK